MRPLVALALVALISAGCGSDAPSETGSASSSERDKAVKFAACMREHGVSDFPDPNASGELTIDGIVNGSSLDPSTSAWKEAIGACKDLQPSGFTGHKRRAEQQDAALEFAQCIRENGVKDFPDPAPDAPLVDTNRIPSSATDGGMTMLNAAMRKCSDFAEELGVKGP
jgi:hypothetical protein